MVCDATGRMGVVYDVTHSVVHYIFMSGLGYGFLCFALL